MNNPALKADESTLAPKPPKVAKIRPAGHNSDELCKKYVENVAKFQNQIDAINEKLKAELRSAKDDGFKKMAIRKAVKALRMTSEQRQAKDEVDDEAYRIFELCRDLPLFAAAV